MQSACQPSIMTFNPDKMVNGAIDTAFTVIVRLSGQQFVAFFIYGECMYERGAI